MKISIFLTTFFIHFLTFSQFDMTPVICEIPTFSNIENDLDNISNSDHGLYDMNGDGNLDLVIGNEKGTNTCWGPSGGQRYWKVYFGDGNSFASISIDWDIPTFTTIDGDLDMISSATHTIVDVDGDGNLDFINGTEPGSNTCWGTTGNQRSWRVYFGDGTSFSNTEAVFNIPTFSTTENDLGILFSQTHGLYDMNGDHKIDFVTGEQPGTGEPWGSSGGQRSWRVYLGDGSSFSSSGSVCNIPTFIIGDNFLTLLSFIERGLYDMNNDGNLDLVTSLNLSQTGPWGTPGNQRYWKVYMGDGTSFSSIATNWNIPTFTINEGDLSVISTDLWGMNDMNGDGLPDLVVGQKPGVSTCWGTLGGQRSWKVHYNTGSSFSNTETDWAIPTFSTTENDLDSRFSGTHGLFDMNGDKKMDFIAGNEPGTLSCWGTTGNQRSWRVYFVENLDLKDYANETEVSLYPNPATGEVNIELKGTEKGAHQMTIYNVLGDEVASQQLVSQITTIKINYLVTGLYFVKIENSNSSTISRLVIK